MQLSAKTENNRWILLLSSNSSISEIIFFSPSSRHIIVHSCFLKKNVLKMKKDKLGPKLFCMDLSQLRILGWALVFFCYSGRPVNSPKLQLLGQIMYNFWSLLEIHVNAQNSIISLRWLQPSQRMQNNGKGLIIKQFWVKINFGKGPRSQWHANNALY